MSWQAYCATHVTATASGHAYLFICIHTEAFESQWTAVRVKSVCTKFERLNPFQLFNIFTCRSAPSTEKKSFLSQRRENENICLQLNCYIRLFIAELSYLHVLLSLAAFDLILWLIRLSHVQWTESMQHRRRLVLEWNGSDERSFQSDALCADMICF